MDLKAVAAQSPCRKRKVGAQIMNNGIHISTGYNHNPNGPCEDEYGNTKPDTIHAEVAAINNARVGIKGATMYVTHEPCDDCKAAIDAAGIAEVIVVTDFMKFDKDKLRYDLVPPEATKALASVLTYGAKKYKANNWQQCTDPSRYVAAAYRHFEAWRMGEQCDPESHLPHLHHVLTNIAFLIWLEEQNNG